MEITFSFAHEFDEEFDVTINGNTIHSPISGTTYKITLNGAEAEVGMESNGFPDVRIVVKEIKIYYIEDNN